MLPYIFIFTFLGLMPLVSGLTNVEQQNFLYLRKPDFDDRDFGKINPFWSPVNNRSSSIAIRDHCGLKFDHLSGLVKEGNHSNFEEFLNDMVTLYPNAADLRKSIDDDMKLLIQIVPPIWVLPVSIRSIDDVFFSISHFITLGSAFVYSISVSDLDMSINFTRSVLNENSSQSCLFLADPITEFVGIKRNSLSKLSSKNEGGLIKAPLSTLEAFLPFYGQGDEIAKRLEIVNNSKSAWEIQQWRFRFYGVGDTPLLIWKEDLDQRDRFMVDGQYVKSTCNEATWELASALGFGDYFSPSRFIMVNGKPGILTTYEAFFSPFFELANEVPPQLLHAMYILSKKTGVNTFRSISEMMGLRGENFMTKGIPSFLTTFACNTDEQKIVRESYQNLNRTSIQSVVLATFLLDASDLQDPNIILQYDPKSKSVFIRLIDYDGWLRGINEMIFYESRYTLANHPYFFEPFENVDHILKMLREIDISKCEPIINQYNLTSVIGPHTNVSVLQQKLSITETIISNNRNKSIGEIVQMIHNDYVLKNISRPGPLG